MSEAPDRALPFFIALGAAAFGYAFRGARFSFWTRMAAGVGGLGLLGLYKDRSGLSKPRPMDLAAGAASAGLLYCVFQVGDRLARRLMPRGADNIASIYDLRRQAPKPVIAGLLGFIIAPGEELFWRGLIQKRLARRRPVGVAVPLGAALYAGVHVPTLNPTLVGAAGVAGLFWGAQYSIQRRLAPVIISHIIWDIWIFLIAPTPGDPARASQAEAG